MRRLMRAQHDGETSQSDWSEDEEVCIQSSQFIDQQEYYPRVESCWATQTATVCRWRPTEVSPMPRELSPMSTPSTSVEAAKLETSMTPPSALEPHPGSSFLHFTFGKTNVIPFQNL